MGETCPRVKNAHPNRINKLNRTYLWSHVIWTVLNLPFWWKRRSKKNYNLFSLNILHFFETFIALTFITFDREFTRNSGFYHQLLNPQFYCLLPRISLARGLDSIFYHLTSGFRNFCCFQCILFFFPISIFQVSNFFARRVASVLI